MDKPGPAFTRRAVLLTVAGTVVGVGALGSPPRHLQAEPASPPPAEDLGPVAVPVAYRKIKTFAVTPTSRWRRPIYDIGDFLKRSPHTHFPRRSVMLTIDDGPHPVWTPKYLRLLQKHDIKATFNMIGEQVLPNRHLVKALASEGHVVANHTWTHDERLPTRTRRDIRREISETNHVLHEVTGIRPNQFRAPGGVWGPKVFAELARQQMMPVDWDIDPRDWARPGTGAIESAMLQAGPGDIILCHDGGGDRSETFRALQVVLPELKHRGFHFVTLPSVLPPT
ncbi:MAG TPA: polysaccharide deacetylase family protein [Marmoricola sp.]|nr:polysaccharide deacetylase family protein [Marmoricola sp.]